MAKHEPVTLDQAVKAAQREHAAVRYPGDLAEDLGLTVGAPRHWLQRWRPALALCAVLMLAVGGAGLWMFLTPEQPTTSAPMVEAGPDSPSPNAPGPEIEPRLIERHNTEVAMPQAVPTREQFMAVKQSVTELRSSAKRDAQRRLAQLLADNQPVKSSVSLQPAAATAADLTAVPHIVLSRPRGLAMPAFSPSFTKGFS